MVKVMNAPGTGWRSQVGAQYQIAGKTGTAQVFTVEQNESYKRWRRSSTSACSITAGSSRSRPRTHPKLAVAVIIENGKHGTAAAPIARRVLDQFILGKTTTPEIPPPVVTPAGAVVAPRRAGRRVMYEPIEVGSRSRRTFSAAGRILGALKLDGPLLVGLGLITLYGLVVLYSASGQNWTA